MTIPTIISENYYAILGIDRNASSDAIKKARNYQALKFHQDKGGSHERMTKINVAFATLSNPQERAKYDQDGDNGEELLNPTSFSFSLPMGYKLSEEFIKKINVWQKQGPPSTDQTKFQNPNLTPSPHLTRHLSYGTSSHYEKLLKSSVPTVEESLKTLIPSTIWHWLVQEIQLIKKEILNLEIWAKDHSSSNVTSSFSFERLDPKYKKVIENLYTMDLKNGPLSLPSTAFIKRSIQSYSAPSSYPSDSQGRLIAGTTIPICPTTNIMKEKLGVIPKHTVKSHSITLKKSDPHCHDCSKLFGWFVWRYHCVLCGESECTECLKPQASSDYVKPIYICNCCKPTLFKKSQVDWIAPLEKEENRKVMTTAYLLLLDEMGYANRTQFLQWVRLFLEDKRYDLAIQANFSAGGDWIKLANKLIKRKQLRYAKICFNQVLKKPAEWLQMGDDYIRDRQFVKAFLAYQQAKLKPATYLQKAFDSPDSSISQMYLIAAVKTLSNSDERISWLDQAFSRALQEKREDIAIFYGCLENFSIEKWVNIVNKIAIEHVDPFIQFMDEHLKCNWNTLSFQPDRDHLRWPFLAPPQFNKWLDYLIALLQKCTGQYCIPYFRAHMEQQNFVLQRDQFFAQGEYFKALICHRLIPNSLSWSELAKKWRSKNELASFACCLASSEKMEAMGDQFFKDRFFSLALRCYLQEKSYHTIQEKAKQVPFEMALLYQIALWKAQPQKQQERTLEICRLLLSKKPKQEEQAKIKNLLIAALQHAEKNLTLPYHKMMAEQELSELELLDLLESISKLMIVEDLTWWNSIVSKAVKKFKFDLDQAIYQCSWPKVFALLERVNSLTLPVMQEAIKQFNLEVPYPGPRQSMGFTLRALTHWLNPKEYSLFQIMNDLTEAMLGNPTEECIQFCSHILEKIAESKNKGALRGHALTNLDNYNPRKTQFSDALKRTPDLRVLIRSEEAISKFKPLEAAYSYIDLTMALPYAPVQVECFLNAALELLKAQKSSNLVKEKYAYRRAIFELVIHAYVIGNRHLCPTTQLSALRASIAILTAAFEQADRISKLEQLFLQDLYRDFDKISTIFPLMIPHLLSIYDTLYLDLINHQFLEKYLPHQRDLERKQGSQHPIYQYCLFEGSWKGWLDRDKFIFEKERRRTMKALLNAKGHTLKEVEELMEWPMLGRDREGWLDPKMPLNLGEGAYSKVEGIRFNLETGEISFLLESSKDPKKSLFNMEDLADIMQRGVTGAQFTLDPPDPNLPSHPFQNIIYGPNCLAGTNYLGTMLHADLLLKMFSMRTEVSSVAPFAFRPITESLLTHLPPDLRKKFNTLREEAQHSVEAAHRFWIEAGKLPYCQSNHKNEITFTFGQCKMSVKKHLMCYDREGKLIDTEEDEETDSYEAKFAKLMTDEYEKLAQSFPLLARLSELIKLQAMAIFAQSIYRSRQETYENLSIPEKNIQAALTDLKKQTTYPQNTSANRTSLLNDWLRQNNVSRSQVPSVQLQESERKILTQCKNADQHCLSQLIKILQKDFYVPQDYPLERDIQEWLKNKPTPSFIQLLKKSLENHEKQNMSKLFNTFKNTGIATKTVDYPLKDRCTWVPAAFGQHDNYRVYGGLNMNTHLTAMPGGAIERSWGDNSLPPKGAPLQPGSTGSGIRHVVGMDANGKIYGTTTCVDQVTGQTYRAVDYRSSVSDQWNNHSYRNTNTTHLLKTHVGDTDVQHSTTHRNGSFHLHYTSGQTTCTNAEGRTDTYDSKKHSHRCEKNQG